MTDLAIGNIASRVPRDHAEDGLQQWAARIPVLWLFLMPVLLPVKFLSFPHHMELVDFWILAGLLIFWTSFLLGKISIIGNRYFVALWLILAGSLISTFAARNIVGSLIVLSKDMYLFVWFITMTMMLSRLSPRHLRLVMLAWAVTVVLHGVLILAEFSSPSLWRAVSGLGGKAVSVEHFRPSGLFISEKAGNANKAALFQLLGFVPVVLTSRSKRIAMALGIVLFFSILATGSMGATIAFSTGLFVAVVTILVVTKNVALIAKTFLPLVIIGAVLGSILVFNDTYRSHFEGIIVGRAEKSSGGRFSLWQRGLDVLVEHNSTLMVGVGPENFRIVDGAGNQLHNDFLAFIVERGLLGGIGLMAIAGIAVSRAFYLFRNYGKQSVGGGLKLIVFLATMIAILVESLTHQVFHARELWLLLAVQEAVFYQFVGSRTAS